MDPTPIQLSWRPWLDARLSRFLLFARDQTRNEADAQDVLQESLFELWRSRADGPPDDPLVYATIRHRAIDLARRNQRRDRREEAAPLEGWFAAGAEDNPLETDLASAVTALPPNLREVVILKTWSGLTFQEIADALEIPLNTAASRYRYGLERLRHALKEAPR